MSAREGKTEKATPRRRKKARSEGQIPRSTELVSWSGTVAATFALPAVVHAAGGRMQALTGAASGAIADPTTAGALSVLSMGLRDVLVIVAPIGAAALIVGLIVGTAQMGRPSLASLKPKFNRLSPKQGVKRVFSTHGPLEAAKSLIRLLAIVAVAYPLVHKMAMNQLSPQDGDLTAAVPQVVGGALHLLRIVAGVGLLVAAGDYAIVRRRTNKQMMMTKQEVKDEFKDNDGDPMVKARRRAIARRMSRHRMMAALSGATAVVVNPTHYAVALRYAPGDSAPRVVAKGVDALAFRIREMATSFDVPIVEDPPLARALHAACEIDERIPGVLFLATARLLAFVYQLPDLAKKYPSVHHTPLSQLPEPALAGRNAA
jgi:flagellar biosynthetic protein FlhB